MLAIGYWILATNICTRNIVSVSSNRAAGRFLCLITLNLVPVHTCAASSTYSSQYQYTMTLCISKMQLAHNSNRYSVCCCSYRIPYLAGTRYLHVSPLLCTARPTGQGTFHCSEDVSKPELKTNLSRPDLPISTLRPTTNFAFERCGKK